MSLHTPSGFSVRGWLGANAERMLGTAVGAIAIPRAISGNEVLRDESRRYTVQLLVAERCGLAAAAGLVNATAEDAHKRFLACQVLDEARHVELFTDRLLALGVVYEELEAVVARHAHPDLLGLSEIVLAPVHEGDFLAGLVAQGLILAEILGATYELLGAWAEPLDPCFAVSLQELAVDEARHAAFAQATAAALLERRPDRKIELARMQNEMTRLMLSTFAEAFRDNPMPAELRRAALSDLRAERPSWAGIDPLASEPSRIEATLERVVNARIRDRFTSLGIGYRRAAVR